MAEKKQTESILEREYIIPLRKEWRKVANYRRAGRATKQIKKFLARHMKIRDRDLSKIKLDMFLNQEIWFRGKTKPPARIKVKAIKDGDIVKVTLAEPPEFIKFEKAKFEKRHKPAEKAKVTSKEEKKDDKMEEEKKEDNENKALKEKETSAAEQKASIAKTQAKAQSKMNKVKETPIRRLALKK